MTEYHRGDACFYMSSSSPPLCIDVPFTEPGKGDVNRWKENVMAYRKECRKQKNVNKALSSKLNIEQYESH